MVPLDAVELSDVVADGVVDAVEVGEAAGVEPPACGARGKCSEGVSVMSVREEKPGRAITVKPTPPSGTSDTSLRQLILFIHQDWNIFSIHPRADFCVLKRYCRAKRY